MTARAAARRHHATQQRLRYQWREQAWGIFATYAKGLRPVWGGHEADYYVVVEDQDWLELPDLAGCRVVQLRFPSPARIDHMAAFRAAWDARMGGSWRWTFDPEHGGWLVGHPFILPTAVPYPAVDHAHLDLVDRVPIGPAEDDTIVSHDLADDPHGMIGGKTQRGKSTVLLLYALHLVQTGRLQAFIVLDPKGGQYPMLEVPPDHPAAWDPVTCTGIYVASPTWDAAGRLVDYRELAAAAEALDRETGRRRIHADTSEAHVPPAYFRQARVVGVFDEIADLLDPEKQPAAKDETEGANRVRARNGHRETISRVLTHAAMMGGGFGVSVLPAAQSPRRDNLPGVIHANTAFKVYLGKGDSTELGILFGKGFGLPPSPVDLPGRGVWLNNRLGASPTDPYLAFQAFYPDPSALAAAVQAFRPTALPHLSVATGGSPNGHIRTDH